MHTVGSKYNLFIRIFFINLYSQSHAKISAIYVIKILSVGLEKGRMIEPSNTIEETSDTEGNIFF